MFNVVLDNNIKSDLVYLSTQTLKQIKIPSDSITLHFGIFTKELRIIIDNSLIPGRIIIPRKLNPEITIPDLPYESYFKDNHLFLGPVIGYIVIQRYFENPALLSLRFINYDKIKGLIFLFRPNTINTNSNIISGRYFNPGTGSFVEGTFPYPSVIFNRTPLSRKSFIHLTNRIGNNLFNYPFFNTNKWSFWKWMSKDPSILSHLPQTTEFTGVQSLLTALDKHKSVYIKPTSLSQGKGILHVLKAGSDYVLSDRSGRKYLFKSPEQLAFSLKNILEANRRYIIQQAIPFISKSGNKIDFRVYIQKDHTGKWKYSGMETKVAQKGSIISNSRNRKMIVPGEVALKSFFELNNVQVRQKIEEITELGIRMLKVLERKSRHLGDAAIDMVLDTNHKVWLLEVQLNYAADKKARRSEDERRVLPAVLPTPFEYAKYLAGF